MNDKKFEFALIPNLPIDSERIVEHAFQTGFCQRLGKIHPGLFWETFCVESVNGTLSYNDLAARIEAQGGPSVSRQAIGKKVNSKGLNFFERILSASMAAQIDCTTVKSLRADCTFKRIIVQDSTVLRLPARLYPVFSGVKNGHSTVSNARIQGVYDILSGRFLHYSIDSYSRNDLVAALDFLPQPGDLVLKDRGYYKLDAIAKCIEQKADFIFRYKHPSNFYCVRTGKKLDLAHMLKEQGSIDMEVIMSSEKGTKVQIRLVAFPVPDEVGNLRRMKAKKEMKGHAPSKEILFLMGWSIFITTLSPEQVNGKQLAELYSLRWRIENIFRTWKSNCCFDHIHNVSEPQLRMLLVARLTMIVFLHHQIFIPLELALAKMGHELSLMKFMRYVQKNLSCVLLHPVTTSRIKHLVDPMIRYCRMEKRKRKSLSYRLKLILSEIHLNP